MEDLEDIMDLSYENSTYEDDSMCTAWTESEPICNNWRGWNSVSADKQHQKDLNKKKNNKKILSLFELTAKFVAQHIPIEIVERCIQTVPEEIHLRLAYWSFPENEGTF